MPSRRRPRLGALVYRLHGFEPGPAAEPRDALCANFLDDGVCGFLEGAENPDREWSPLAKSFIGKYKTPTLRNVDKRPRPDFVKAYMHNGYLKSLKEAVHFYNTRDALPHCKAGDPGEKVTCWPAPEHPETMNRRQLGNLGLHPAGGSNRGFPKDIDGRLCSGRKVEKSVMTYKIAGCSPPREC